MFQKQLLSAYEGAMESPWDEIAIQYVLVVNHCAKRRASEAFKEECQLVRCVLCQPSQYCSIIITLCSLFFRYFVQHSGWTLPALFSILRDLRDLAFDVSS